MPVIKFVPTADATVVSEHSKVVLKDVLTSAGLDSCVITSTVRNPEKQARAMYVNIEASSVAQQLALYAAAGDSVINEYQRLKPLGHGRQIIIDAMENKIKQVGPSNVSRHCADPSRLNVVDISPKSILNATRFLAALEQAKIAGRVLRYFSPANGDPAFHVEIPQP